MTVDVKKYIKECKICQQVNPASLKFVPELKSVSVPKKVNFFFYLNFHFFFIFLVLIQFDFSLYKTGIQADWREFNNFTNSE